MPRNYVDNAYNRSVGRVGMPVGTAVISSSSGGGGGGGRSSGGGGGSYSSYSSGYSSSSPRTYVDNSMNRSLGRVGLEVGSAVHSKSSGNTSYSSSSSTGTYVDNSMNRSLGRVGLPLGSAVHSTGSSSGLSKSSSSSYQYVDNPPASSSSRSDSVAKPEKSLYVDNAYNRRLGRVGLPFGSFVVSKASSSTLGHSSTSTSAQKPTKCYVDNPMNRKLGRVGLPVGTAPITNSKATSPSYSYSKPKDDCFLPLRQIDPEDHNLNDVMREIMRLRNQLLVSENPDPLKEQMCEAAMGIVNRHEAALTKYTSKLATPNWVKGGEVIPFEDLEMGNKLGGGGFGDVFVGFWKQSQVAIKKLRVQRVSQAKKQQFEAEVRVFSQLNHPAIVQFYGACVTSPNLAIVMEFMPGGSMYDILHVEERPLTREQKENMVTDCLSALKYLHRKDVTHRDIKSMNILICEDYSHCKLSDFGLAIKEDTRTSASVADHSVVGTLLYSPPEVLQGQRLKLEGLKCADVYSMAVVLVELLTMREPFKGMNQHQVRRAVLNDQRPAMEAIKDEATKGLLLRGMAAVASERPTASEFFREWETAMLAGALSRLDIQPSSSSKGSTTTLPLHLSLATTASLSSTDLSSTGTTYYTANSDGMP